MLGLPIESSLTLARSREEFAAETLITDKQGVSWEQRMRFARNLALSYVYRFERNHTFDTDPDPDFPFDLTINIARLIGTAAWDTRDDPADATRGGLLSSSLEYAPEPLGSDIRFVRYLAQAYYFRPIGRLVLASAGRVGLAAALGGQDFIPSERFFAGGARTVRGAQEDGLGPRDFFGDPTGGEALLVLNQEARVPLYRWLRGVAFVDFGNVFEKPSAITFGGLEGAMGFGFRLETPFALLRVDYGRLFSPEPGQRSGRWSFGIGQAF
jgi:outer membrane protein assembly factor BamA